LKYATSPSIFSEEREVFNFSRISSFFLSHLRRMRRSLNH